MSHSLRRVSRAAAVARLAATGLVALISITCARDQATAPVGQTVSTYRPLHSTIPSDSGLRALESPPTARGHINVLANGNYELVPQVVGTYPTPTIVTAHVSGIAEGAPWKQPWYFTERGYLGNCGGYMPLLAGWNECLASRYIRVSGSVQMAGNWLPVPANCGQWNTDPCPTFSGGYDGELDRLDATIELAPTDTAIHPGGTATIQWHAVPDSLGGFVTPTTFERGYFDPDSSSGYAADTSRVCTVIGNSCKIAPRGSGTLHLWVMANGQLVHKTAHVTMPTLVLRANPTSGPPGVRVTFTPSWTDGTAITGTVDWQWTPDTPPGRTSACGFSGWNFVCITQVYESGTMTVILHFNGSDFRASAHVRVSQCPQGDSLLDRPEIRDAIKLAWTDSHADTDPREVGYGVYQDTNTKELFYQAVTNPGSACSADMSLMPRYLGTAKLITFIHAHPVHWNSVYPGECSGPDHDQRYYYPLPIWNWGGRASGDDWAESHRVEVPGFIIDYDGVYKYDGTNVAVDSLGTDVHLVHKEAKDHYKSWPLVDSQHSCTIP